MKDELEKRKMIIADFCGGMEVESDNKMAKGFITGDDK